MGVGTRLCETPRKALRRRTQRLHWKPCCLMRTDPCVCSNCCRSDESSSRSCLHHLQLSNPLLRVCCLASTDPREVCILARRAHRCTQDKCRRTGPGMQDEKGLAGSVREHSETLGLSILRRQPLQKARGRLLGELLRWPTFASRAPRQTMPEPRARPSVFPRAGARRGVLAPSRHFAWAGSFCHLSCRSAPSTIRSSNVTWPTLARLAGHANTRLAGRRSSRLDFT
mmetsp:Transcript_82607/g.157407  ORF Transcript_82607/g.157407 Transcript_82607/m.157407 type:complete len:227 (+) Transcript_82607:3621-4301(+)